MPLSMEDILMQDYDTLKRDGNGTIVYDERLKQVAENLLKQRTVDSRNYRTYDEFFNALLDSTHQLNDCKVHSLPENPECEYRYVNDVITREIWTNWLPSNRIFISAGTGRGKNTFIRKELLKQIGSQGAVIFENRDSLMQQQIVDIVSEIDPDELKYHDVVNDGLVVFGAYKNFMIVSYQTAAIKFALGDSSFLNFCNSARYLIFDEAHYILDDARFNKGINFVVNYFMMSNRPLNATKIFMSGSMEEFFSFSQELQPFTIEPIDVYKEKKTLDEKQKNSSPSQEFKPSAYPYDTYEQVKRLSGAMTNGNNEAHNIFRRLTSEVNGNYVLSMPTDYSYIQPYKYTQLSDICSQIAQSAIDEKWLIFVKSIEEGVKLKSDLQDICGDSVCFLNAENKENTENSPIYKNLVYRSRFDCRVLIATTVIYNGINIKDKNVKHIVVPFGTVSIVKQLIGRKRMEDNETVNVYFPDVSYTEVKKRYLSCIREYMEMIGLKRNLPAYTTIQTNGLAEKQPSKYYYLSPERFGNVFTLRPCINSPAAHKLHYDTCFYIFALQRMNPELGDNASDFISVLLKHLGIESKYKDMTDVTVELPETRIQNIKEELAAYLDKLTDSPIVVPDGNGSYDALLELKKVIHEAYKKLHDGKNIDTQWRNKDRFFSEEKIKAFFSEISLPYIIKNERTKEKRKIMITKQEA